VLRSLPGEALACDPGDPRSRDPRCPGDDRPARAGHARTAGDGGPSMRLITRWWRHGGNMIITCLSSCSSTSACPALPPLYSSIPIVCRHSFIRSQPLHSLAHPRASLRRRKTSALVLASPLTTHSHCSSSLAFGASLPAVSFLAPPAARATSLRPVPARPALTCPPVLSSRDRGYPPATCRGARGLLVDTSVPRPVGPQAARPSAGVPRYCLRSQAPRQGTRRRTCLRTF
jgi:hypothetical protein